jgi:hypothetical protein
MPGPNSETQGRFCDGLSSNIVEQYTVGPIITLHGGITAKEYVDRLGNQVHPMIQTLFPKKDVLFQHHNAPIHIAETVHSWFEEHEGQLHHLPWSTQSPDLETIDSVWSGLGTRMRNRFPPPPFLKKLEDNLQELWYKIPLEAVQNCFESITIKIVVVLKAKGGPTPYYL